MRPLRGSGSSLHFSICATRMPAFSHAPEHVMVMLTCISTVTMPPYDERGRVCVASGSWGALRAAVHGLNACRRLTIVSASPTEVSPARFMMSLRSRYKFSFFDHLCARAITGVTVRRASAGGRRGRIRQPPGSLFRECKACAVFRFVKMAPLDLWSPFTFPPAEHMRCDHIKTMRT